MQILQHLYRVNSIITSKEVNSCRIKQLNCWKQQPLMYRLEFMLRRRTKSMLVYSHKFERTRTHGNEQVRNLSLILSPSLTVLVPAALDITQRTVTDHARKEQRVEPRERAVKASDKTPVQSKVQIAGIVDLASLAIPSINHNLGAIGSGEGLRVLHSLPRQLGEGVTEDHGATFHLAETVLLAVGRVPHPVHEQVCDVEEGQEVAIPVVG